MYKKDDRIHRMVQTIKQFGKVIEVSKDNAQWDVYLDSIYYAESVDGKTFIYDKDTMYLYKGALATLEKEISQFRFIRISKSCLLNIMYLKSVKPYPNHRLLIELKNKEKLVVSRNYIDELKKALKRGV